MANNFCSSCGSPLNPGARFCGSCGQALAATTNNPPPPAQYTPPAPPPYQQPPGYPLPPYHTPPYQQQGQAYVPPIPSPAYTYVPPQSAPVAPAEAVVGVLPCLSRKKGMFGMESYNAVVTPTRIIFATMTGEMIKQEASRATGNFVAKMASAATAGYHLWKRYLEMTPDQALQENPQNFVVYTNQIRKVKYDGGRTLFKKGVVSVGLSFKGNERDDEPAHLEIETVGNKLRFDVASPCEGDVREVLKRAGLIN